MDNLRKKSDSAHTNFGSRTAKPVPKWISGYRQRKKSLSGITPVLHPRTDWNRADLLHPRVRTHYFSAVTIEQLGGENQDTN